jgi:ribosomal-protein-alanine N-acetyltransferase
MPPWRRVSSAQGKPLFLFAKPSATAPLIGAKCYLRAPEQSDFAAWVSLRQKSRAFLEKWEPSWTAEEFSRVAYRYRLRVYGARALEDQAYAYFIFDSATHELVGGLTLSHVRRGVSMAATLGYWVGEPFARKGYMTDAIRCVIGAARGQLGLHRLEAACIPRNEASRKVLLKCGFEAEGYARQYVKIAGVWEDHLLFGLIVP